GPPERPGRGVHPEPAADLPRLLRAGRGPERGPQARVGAQAAHPAGEGRPSQAAAGGGGAGAEGSVFRFRPAPRTIASTEKMIVPMTRPASMKPRVFPIVLMVRGSHSH